jgi:hypothetical protein
METHAFPYLRGDPTPPQISDTFRRPHTPDPRRVIEGVRVSAKRGELLETHGFLIGTPGFLLLTHACSTHFVLTHACSPHFVLTHTPPNSSRRAIYLVYMVLTDHE